MKPLPLFGWAFGCLPPDTAGDAPADESAEPPDIETEVADQ